MTRFTAAMSSGGDQSSFFPSVTADELLVAEILLDLRNTFPFPTFPWGCRKARSIPGATLFSPRPAAPKSPSRVQRIAEDVEEPRHRRVLENEYCAIEAASTSSPATPLSFFPSETDEKFNLPSKKNSKKRSREEYIHMIDELTQEGDLLRRELGNARKHHDKLKAQNSQLKAFSREALNPSRSNEEPLMAFHQRPLIINRAAQEFQHSSAAQPSSSLNGLEEMGRVEGLDLNLSLGGIFLGGAQPSDVSDDRRTRFSEARRMRRGIIKISARGIASPPFHQGQDSN